MIKKIHIMKVDLTKKKSALSSFGGATRNCHTSLVRKKTAQYSSNDTRKLAKRPQPPITIPNDLPIPDFMPTKLVRISDMKVVDGYQVNKGYCALSYSWNQSGDILLDEKTGKYVRIDEGEHKIISYDDIFPNMIIPKYKIPFTDDYVYLYEKSFGDHGLSKLLLFKNDSIRQI
ncbi:hypothetical protein BDA99DRAFT_591784 [Phascolomyces articulosus]|uniref:Uncharacterized protein n=1 Tax=Phascolomyces articulosus TaxID=60185 RepID=A0AAD5JYB8_9FUNG|nr:hypothetical protein BDA99DRAFT_591784 [Phascolomyces articulosus]